jgi:hypothetical protein
MKKIIVIVRGGLVEEVKKSPEDLNVLVEVHDYDTLDEEDEGFKLDDKGEGFVLTEY